LQGRRGDHFVEFARSANSEVKNRYGGRFLTAQGIEAEILLCRFRGTKDWSGKPGFRRMAPEMRPKQKDQNS
jgi:hypothetical protein